MSTIQVHYDGWLALPEAVWRKLGVGTGGRLEVEFADGAVVLRPSRRGGVGHPTVPPTPPSPAAGGCRQPCRPRVPSRRRAAARGGTGAAAGRRAGGEAGPRSSAEG